MKRILSLLLASVCFLGAQAQTKAGAKKKPVAPAAGVSAEAKLNTALCGCFSKKDTTTFQTLEDFNQQFMLCISADPASSTAFLNYIQAKNLNTEDEDAMLVAGHEVGERLALSCPVVFRTMLRLNSARMADSTGAGK